MNRKSAPPILLKTYMKTHSRHVSTTALAQRAMRAIKNKSNLVTLSIFFVVGICATLTNALALIFFIEIITLPPSLGAVAAFLTAVPVSYFGHYYYTFKAKTPHAQTWPKHFLTTVLGSCANFLAFYIVVERMQMNYWIAFGVSFFTIPPMTFLISRYMVFTKGR